MNTIATFVLRAKHWQIFLILVGVFGFGEMVAVGVLAENVSSPERIWPVGFLWGAITAFDALCFVGWLWAMGAFLNSIAPPSLRLKTGFWEYSLIYPVAYVCVAAPFFLNPSASIFAIIIPLHFLALFCLFYDLRFASKCLVLAETGKPASFYEYAGPFFLIWFFPLGIWFIQPRINRLYANRRNAVPSIQAATL
jgi:hypothetical protein